MSVEITLQDGVSGIVTGAQEGKALITGYCSKGVPGQAYYIGASTDIPEVLGAGPLVDRLQDVFSVADDAVVIAVPAPTATFANSLGQIDISPAGVTGEALFDVAIENFGEASIHKHAKDLAVTGTNSGDGAEFPMNDGEHYRYSPETGAFEIDYYIERVAARVQYDSQTNGSFDGELFFIDGVLEIPAPEATNIVIKSWENNVERVLTEGVDYTRDMLVYFRLQIETLDTIKIPRYAGDFSVSMQYKYSEFEQGTKTVALPKYVQNVRLTPDLLYHIEYDPVREANILRIDAPMTENLTCTWESEVDAHFEKSREAAPELKMVGIGKKACSLVLLFGEAGGLVPTFSGGAGGVLPPAAGPVIEHETNWSVASYQVSYDGGNTYSVSKKVPYDGRLELEEIGISVIVPETPLLLGGDRYAIDVAEPTVAASDVMAAIEDPLDENDVEFVAVCGAMPSDSWPVWSQKADDLWAKHRPTFFLMEYRKPAKGESVDNWVSVLLAERVQFAHPFLACCPAYGNVSGNTRNLMGLLAGRLLSIPVMRSIGRVRDGGLATVQLPEGYNESHQKVLEDAGYITAKNITGLKNPYFGSARTLAEENSDFRYIEILRVVFKACRLARLRALNSIHDESGDPLLGSDASGIAYLKSNLESAVGTMKTAIPKEIVDFVITIPNGQDIVNNGLRLGLRLIGIPIIRELEIFASYTYAGSTFDPRLEAVS